jgi:WD40 repeat protein
VSGLAFSPDGNRLAALADDALYAWDLTTMTPLPKPDESAIPRYDRRAAKFLSFLADSVHVALPWSLSDDPVRLWNTSTGEVAECSRGDLRYENARVASADGRFLATYGSQAGPGNAASSDGAAGEDLVIWDRVANRRCPPAGLSWAYAFFAGASQKTCLVSRLADDVNRLGVWELPEGRICGWLEGHTDNVYDIACSPDGTRIATAGRDTLRIWSTQTYEEIVQLRGHTSFVWSVAFSPDGTTLASGSGDRTVRLWGTRSPVERAAHSVAPAGLK